jgi:hypothetical protein
MTAMMPDVLLSGSRPPSFFSSTIDSRAAVRASAWCSSQSLRAYGIAAHGTRAGGSNMPRRIAPRTGRLTHDVDVGLGQQALRDRRRDLVVACSRS